MQSDSSTIVAKMPLDEAWAEAESLLPTAQQSWLEVWLRHPDFRDPPAERYWATAYVGPRNIEAQGASPSLALRALAAKLREGA